MTNELNDFIQGQSDCKKGIPHKSGHSEAYDRGYAAQYELEQINTYWSEKHGH